MSDSAASSASPPPPTPGEDLSGRKLADYQLLRKLGRGAMADVYLAEQLSLERKVAFKVLKSELATDTNYVERFHREARAAAALVHANIVQVYEVGESQGIHYIAQEYVQGQNLAQRLTRSGPPELSVVVGIMRQVAAALAKAGSQGIVHRDIKPENLMLATTGEVKVADFGLARVAEGREQSRLTQDGMTMGSPLYMSPEQIEGKPLDPRSDIYSLGVTCYQMLAGQPPFRAESSLSVALEHLRTEPERLENIRADLPIGLCRIVHRMLAKNPTERYEGGTQVLRELRDLNLDGLEGDWPEELEQFNTAEMVALSDLRSAATQQLSTVMASKESSRPLVRAPFFWVSIAVALLFGIFLGWPRSEPFLLADAEQSHTEVPLMASGEGQYLLAKRLGTEAGWQSVLVYFPDDEHYGRLARKQLAEVYLNEDRRYDAMKIFHDFVNQDGDKPAYLAYGLAGQYVTMIRDQEMDSARQVLDRLWPLRDRLKKFDRAMTRRVFELVIEHKQVHKQEQRAEIEDWLRRHTSEAG